LLQAKAKNNYNYGYFNKQNNTKKPANKYSFKTVLVTILSLVFIAAILILYICQSVEITHLNYQLVSLKEELNSKQEEIYQLNIEVARSTSLARIEEIARTKLKMVEPEQVEIIVLNNEENKTIDMIDKEEGFFIVKMFDNLLNRGNTVKAGEL